MEVVTRKEFSGRISAVGCAALIRPARAVGHLASLSRPNFLETCTPSRFTDDESNAHVNLQNGLHQNGLTSPFLEAHVGTQVGDFMRPPAEAY